MVIVFSDHLKRVHKLRTNLRTYFEDEKRISSGVKRGGGSGITPKLKCDRCSYVTENLTIWTKHDCNIVKIEKPASNLSTSDQTSVDSSSIDQGPKI